MKVCQKPLISQIKILPKAKTITKNRNQIQKPSFSSLNLLANYKKFQISFGQSKKLCSEEIEQLKVPNIHVIQNNCVRGETLSSKKNRKFIPVVKNYGIENVVDLRDKYVNKRYENMCENVGIKYYHIPIDSYETKDRDIILNMPELFDALNSGNTYIACAQGLHRTDIALAINYVFNPSTTLEPPLMYGHFRENGFKKDDILRRVNSLKKEFSKEDIEKLGWRVETFDEDTQRRKNLLIQYNSRKSS